MKSRREQADTDPLPFVQVDRSAHSIAAVLAPRLGVSFQHALGGLVVFWQRNGDPRELAALLKDGRREVVLAPDEFARRFNAAMALNLDPRAVEALELGNLIERRPDGFRVRGMARFFKPLEKRSRRAAAATAAGQASARARAEKFGSAQPSRSTLRSADVRDTFEGRSAERSAGGRNVKTDEPQPEHPPERSPNARRTQRTEVQISSPVLLAPSAPEAPEPANFRQATADLCAVFREACGAEYLWQGAKDSQALKALLKTNTPTEILLRWRRGLQATGWRETCSVAQLRTKWNELATDAGARARGPTEATRGEGPITARRLS